MNSKEIAVNYLAPKIINPVMIFEDINLFLTILPWAKDSAIEFFETQTSKQFLVPYVDDVAPIVNNYLINRVPKMYAKAFKTKNKLFYNLSSSEKTIAWIIDRWINMFINLTTNKKYKDYIDISKIKIHYCDIAYINSDNDEDIFFLIP